MTRAFSSAGPTYFGMMSTSQLLLSLALVAITLESALSDQSYIIGGQVSEPGKWPWVVSLHRYREDEGIYRHSCGGALIHPNYVLTAAHCTQDKMETYLAKVGMFSQSKGDQQQTFKIVKIINHEKYGGGTPGYPNDISILELDSPADLSNPLIGLAKLPRYDDEFAHNPDCWIAGWGRINNDPSNWTAADELREVNTDVWTLKECRQIWRDFTGKDTTNIMDQHICIGSPDLGACHGDSGSPAVCDMTGKSDWVVAGLNSWGTGSHCSAATNAFVRVTYFLDWIKSKVPGLPGSGPQ